MYLEHFELSQSPFPEEPDTSIFFNEGERDNILDSVLSDLRSGKSLIKLTGSEGSGKTLMCRLVLERLPEVFEPIFLDNPLGSFEDLLRVICLDLGMDPSPEASSKQIVEDLKAQLIFRKKSDVSVVIIIDEAEKLFLATLERLIRILCEAEETDTLQILLVGRPRLDANLEQLTVYCSTVDINTGYFLEPLTLQETGNYLNFRLAMSGLNRQDHKEIFTTEAVEKIFEGADGNIRLTNILAEEALQKSCSEKSFLVLLEHVKSQSDDRSELRRRLAVVPSALKKNSILSRVEIPEKFKPSRINDSLNKNKFIRQNKKQVLGAAVMAFILLLIFIFSGGGESPKEKPADISPKSSETFQSVAGQAKTELQPPFEYVEQTEEVEEQVQADIKEKPEEVDDPKEVFATLEPEIIKEKPPRNANVIYEKRLRASASWLAGAYKGAHTIQLMMLASKQGEQNLRKMLVQDEYFAIKDNLFILRKKTSPPTLFVFYGSYKDLDEARVTRNEMAPFLRKHHPYALSISDALKKTED